MASCPSLSHQDYTVGLICTFPTEMAAACGMLDERHSALPSRPHDNNNYAFGRIGDYNVVIACLPAGMAGTISAARVTTQMLSTFKSLRFGLMVGIGGGVPSEEHDIRLGDVVVSQPTETFGGVIQYDFGKTVQEGKFIRTGSLNKPLEVLLTALASLQSKHLMERHELSTYFSEMTRGYPMMEAHFASPSTQHDSLYDAQYDHPSGNKTCLQCDAGRLVHRETRPSKDPVIHYGLIASGDQVMGHGATRDRLRKELDVLCFETEAAGLMDSFPCLVIRGICNYADSHKDNDKRWQPYAAAMAAAYAKELLSIIPGNQVMEARTAAETITTTGTQSSYTVPGPIPDAPSEDWAMIVRGNSSHFEGPATHRPSPEPSSKVCQPANCDRPPSAPTRSHWSVTEPATIENHQATSTSLGGQREGNEPSLEGSVFQNSRESSSAIQENGKTSDENPRSRQPPRGNYLATAFGGLFLGSTINQGLQRPTEFKLPSTKETVESAAVTLNTTDVLQNLSGRFKKIDGAKENHDVHQVSEKQTLPESRSNVQAQSSWRKRRLGLASEEFDNIPTKQGSPDSTENKSHGFYDALIYHYSGSPKFIKNPSQRSTNHIGPPSCYEVAQRPRYLCILNEHPGVRVEMVSEWSYSKSIPYPEYAFISYSMHQFGSTEEDLKTLHRLAERATRDLGLQAFWIACSCLVRHDREDMDEDVYSICDILRGSQSSVILVASTSGSPSQSTEELLRAWGERCWNLQDLLLAPTGRPILVYQSKRTDSFGHVGKRLQLSKRQLAAMAWGQHPLMKQLIEHYEGTLMLSRLEVVLFIMAMLAQLTTILYYPGDHSYILMGFLRCRPKVEPTDSAFQAFARVLLYNDVDFFLERLICLQPMDIRQPWHCFNDAWEISLRDIHPTCEVSGIGHSDTLIVEGPYGAAIRCESVRQGHRDRASRTLLTEIMLWRGRRKKSPSPGSFFMVFDGYVTTEEIETRQLSGTFKGCLKWSVNGSPLSRSQQNERGQHVGQDPAEYEEIRSLIERAKMGWEGEPIVFTLVDTYTMTATLFQAARRPTAVLLCGREGGMHRALLCSYNPETETLHREATIRMDTRVRERMFPIARLQLSLQSQVTLKMPKPISYYISNMSSSNLHNQASQPYPSNTTSSLSEGTAQISVLAPRYHGGRLEKVVID